MLRNYIFVVHKVEKKIQFVGPILRQSRVVYGNLRLLVFYQMGSYESGLHGQVVDCKCSTVTNSCLPESNELIIYSEPPACRREFTFISDIETVNHE